MIQHPLNKNNAHPVPQFRKPTRANIENLMPASRQRAHHAQNAFALLNLFAEKNQDRVFLWVMDEMSLDV